MSCMTEEELQVLHKDIESGLVMIVTCAHYKQLEAENKKRKRGLRAILSLYNDAGAIMNANYTKIARQMSALAEEYLYLKGSAE